MKNKGRRHKSGHGPYANDNCKEGYFAVRFILSHKTFVHQLFNFIQDDNT